VPGDRARDQSNDVPCTKGRVMDFSILSWIIIGLIAGAINPMMIQLRILKSITLPFVHGTSRDACCSRSTVRQPFCPIHGQLSCHLFGKVAWAGRPSTAYLRWSILVKEGRRGSCTPGSHLHGVMAREGDRGRAGSRLSSASGRSG